MTRPPGLVLDLSRLFAGVLRGKPRGIDRVEMLYARHLLAHWPADCVSLLAAPTGPQIFHRDRAWAGLDLLEAIWGERPRRDALAALGRMGLALGRSATRDAPSGAIYLNVGHLTLSSTPALSWLGRRPDVSPVFMLHDLIPLDHPELVSPRERAYFGRILGNLPLARGLIVNTQAVAAHPALAAIDAPKLVAPLPVSAMFLANPRPTDEPTPYVLTYGEIERRKNVHRLVEAWTAMAPDQSPPTLVIATSGGDALADLEQTISRLDPTGARIRLRKGLSTEALRDLISGAEAVLAPSMAEGFGLPVAEALALGIPVIASDIPAHREVGGRHGSYVDCAAPDGWTAVARQLAQPTAARVLKARVKGYRAQSASNYFAQVEAFLMHIAVSQGHGRLKVEEPSAAVRPAPR